MSIQISEDPNVMLFEIKHLENGTYLASAVGSSTAAKVDTYDHDGAVKYVLAVLIVYGMSIFIMIASLIRKSHSSHDDGSVESYFKEIKTIRMTERRQHKQKMIDHVNQNVDPQFAIAQQLPAVTSVCLLGKAAPRFPGSARGYTPIKEEKRCLQSTNAESLPEYETIGDSEDQDTLKDGSKEKITPHFYRDFAV